MTSRVVSLENWPRHLREWIGGTDASSRAPVDLAGTLGKSTEEFPIAQSRDAAGSVLRVMGHLSTPALPSRNEAGKKEKEKEFDEKRKRVWRQMWTKVATRAGYAMPNIDPSALARLLSLRGQATPRIELIFDTNALIDGAGHWLVRMLGDRVDLVRTTVSELEIQRFGDTLAGADGWKEVEARFHFNAASRFLESVPHPHPVWRRLDTAEETALFVAKASDSAGKSPGLDALLLRATRRSLQDIVPGMARFFVTADAMLARSATHELPANATIAAYAVPFPERETFLSSLTWWPGKDQGAGCISSLGEFVWECLTLCSSVIIKRHDGRRLRVAAFKPGDNQFPSEWSAPRVWIHEESPPTRVPPSSGGTPGPETEEPARSRWPLAERPRPTGSSAVSLEPAKDKILDAVWNLARRTAPGSQKPGGEPPRELARILRALGLVDETGNATARAGAALSLFSTDDTDGISDLFRLAQPYATLLDSLEKNKSLTFDEATDLLGRSQAPATGIARYLGQAVREGSSLHWGGGCVSEADFRDWLWRAIDELVRVSPLKEASIADIARLALAELGVSPLRLRRALRLVLSDPANGITPSAGGSPNQVLSEKVVNLSDEGIRHETLSADGLMGFRTLRRVTK